LEGRTFEKVVINSQELRFLVLLLLALRESTENLVERDLAVMLLLLSPLFLVSFPCSCYCELLLHLKEGIARVFECLVFEKIMRMKIPLKSRGGGGQH